MKFRTLTTLVPLALLFSCAATDTYSSSASAVSEPMLLNETCPLMGMDVDPAITSAYGDGAVGFCCAGCKKKWDTFSDEEKAARLAD